MISRVLTVGFMLLSVTLACAPASAGPHPCPEFASAPADAVTELAVGMTHAFGAQAKDAPVVDEEQKKAATQHVSCAQEVEIVPVVASAILAQVR
jgi:hypothetical protein